MLTAKLRKIAALQSRAAAVKAMPSLAAYETLVADLLDAIESPELDVETLATAMQNIQDRTYLDVNNHRYHCGGSEASFLAAEYHRLRESAVGEAAK